MATGAGQNPVDEGHHRSGASAHQGTERRPVHRVQHPTKNPGEDGRKGQHDGQKPCQRVEPEDADKDQAPHRLMHGPGNGQGQPHKKVGAPPKTSPDAAHSLGPNLRGQHTPDQPGDEGSQGTQQTIGQGNQTAMTDTQEKPTGNVRLQGSG